MPSPDGRTKIYTDNVFGAEQTAEIVGGFSCHV